LRASASINGVFYQAVKEVTFELEEGKVTCIIGPSGCGKSTMLNLVGGFIKPARGRMEVGSGLLSLAQLRKAFVFQDYALLRALVAEHSG
jgi:NitT/TauT family transport system ATP-binding protein